MGDSRILLGVIGRPHGVRGHVHVHSYTAVPTDLARYGVLVDGGGRAFTLRWLSGDVAEICEIRAGVVVKIDSRDAAERLINTQLYVARGALPQPAPDEFYLADLIGLAAESVLGETLGVVAAVHDYGAGTSVEIERAGAAALLLPFTKACVPVVDVAARRLVVCPPAEIVIEGAVA